MTPVIRLRDIHFWFPAGRRVWFRVLAPARIRVLHRVWDRVWLHAKETTR